jgi:hypothetical protein
MSFQQSVGVPQLFSQKIIEQQAEAGFPADSADQAD